MRLRTSIEALEDLQIYIRGIEGSDLHEALALSFMSERYLADAIEALKKSEKYRWHDLRKDPDDLPNKGGMYIVCIKYLAEEKEVGVAFYEIMHGYKSGWNMLMPNDGNIIAWKEIEPFEKDEV